MAYKDDDEGEWHDDEHETLADRKYADSQRDEDATESRVERDAAEASSEEKAMHTKPLATPLTNH